MQVGQKVEIKVSRKFFIYFRQAYGVARLSYNWGLAEFKKAYDQYIEDMKIYYRDLSIYNEYMEQLSSLPAGAILAQPQPQMPVKPQLVTAMELKKRFNAIKKVEYPYVLEVTKYASQQAFIHLGRAISNYFESRNNGKRSSALNYRKKKGKKYKKVCFPEFKKKSYTSGSFYIGGDQIKVIEGTELTLKDPQVQNSKRQYLSIPNFGYVQLKERLRFEGHINSVTISQKGDRLFASFNIDITDEEYQRTHGSNLQEGTAVGIDVGLKSAMVLSDGMAIQSSKPLKRNLRKLRRLSRQLARKQHPRTKDDETPMSNNYKKLVRKIAKLHYIISCQRRDFIHKATTALVRLYEYISIEDLNVKGMMANHKLARALSDVSFSAIKEKLEYKAKANNRKIIKVDRFYPSSKTCCKCGYIKNDLKLSERIYECPNCGNKIDRDYQASINLRNQMIKEKIGQAMPESKPVELEQLQELLTKNGLVTQALK